MKMKTGTRKQYNNFIIYNFVMLFNYLFISCPKKCYTTFIANN